MIGNPAKSHHNIRTIVTDMGGNDDDKWFIAGCFNCRGINHLQHQCLSRTGATSSRGKQKAGSHYGSSLNISTAASASSGGSNRRPPPPKKHPKAGPSRVGGQPGGQAASTSRATATGRKRARDPTSLGFTSPNKQANGSTRFSYDAAVEGGERVVLISLDGTRRMWKLVDFF